MKKPRVDVHFDAVHVMSVPSRNFCLLLFVVSRGHFSTPFTSRYIAPIAPSSWAHALHREASESLYDDDDCNQVLRVFIVLHDSCRRVVCTRCEFFRHHASFLRGLSLNASLNPKVRFVAVSEPGTPTQRAKNSFRKLLFRNPLEQFGREIIRSFPPVYYIFVVLQAPGARQRVFFPLARTSKNINFRPF